VVVNCCHRIGSSDRFLSNIDQIYYSAVKLGTLTRKMASTLMTWERKILRKFSGILELQDA
jgi:hypothetical protein